MTFAFWWLSFLSDADKGSRKSQMVKKHLRDKNFTDITVNMLGLNPFYLLLFFRKSLSVRHTSNNGSIQPSDQARVSCSLPSCTRFLNLCAFFRPLVQLVYMPFHRLWPSSREALTALRRPTGMVLATVCYLHHHHHRHSH